MVWIWDIEGRALPKSLGPFPGFPRSLSWSPDGKMLAAGSDDGKLMVMELAANRVLQVWEWTEVFYAEVSDVAWQGSRLVFKDGEAGLQVYDFEKNEKWRWGPGEGDQWRYGSYFGTAIAIKGLIGSLDDGVVRLWTDS